MGIFRPASELNKTSSTIQKAFFKDELTVEDKDAFEGLSKEAALSLEVYANRLKSFKKKAEASVDIDTSANKPMLYNENSFGTVRRVDYGTNFKKESSELNAKNLLLDMDNLGELSIWSPEFQELRLAFKESSDASNTRYDRVLKAKARQSEWENEKVAEIRKSKVLPYRGLGVTRISGDVGLDDNKFNSVDEFYGHAQDEIRKLVKESNASRKSAISRNGNEPSEEIDLLEAHQRIQGNLGRQSFLSSFAEKFEE